MCVLSCGRPFFILGLVDNLIDLIDDLDNLVHGQVFEVFWLVKIEGRGRVNGLNNPVSRGPFRVKVLVAFLGIGSAAGSDGATVRESDIFICVVARAGIRTRGIILLVVLAYLKGEVKALLFGHLEVSLIKEYLPDIRLSHLTAMYYKFINLRVIYLRVRISYVAEYNINLDKVIKAGYFL